MTWEAVPIPVSHMVSLWGKRAKAHYFGKKIVMIRVLIVILLFAYSYVIYMSFQQKVNPFYN